MRMNSWHQTVKHSSVVYRFLLPMCTNNCTWSHHFVPLLFSPLLTLLLFLPVLFELQQFCLPFRHLVLEVAALDLHASQQPLQLLHLLTPLLRPLLRRLQLFGPLGQTSAALVWQGLRGGGATEWDRVWVSLWLSIRGCHVMFVWLCTHKKQWLFTVTVAEETSVTLKLLGASL